jgi:hypothetical protein
MPHALGPLSNRSIRFAAIALLLAAAATAGGCDKADATKSAGSSSKDTTAGSGNKAPLYKLTAEQFAKEFASGQEATVNHYKNGLVEVTGIVDQVDVNVVGDAVISLRAGPRKEATADGPAQTPVVDCHTKEPEPWSKLAPGQEATYRGTVGYLPLVPNLENCQLISSGAPTVISVTSKDLAAEFSKNRAAARQKYAGKTLIVAGKVIDKKADVSGSITLTLEGEGAVKLLCGFGMIESTIKKVVPAIQVGQMVKVYCEPLRSASNDDSIQLTSCRLITN